MKSGADRTQEAGARFDMLIKPVVATGRRAGRLTDDLEVVHVPFGTGPDGKPFKTRSGGTVRLTSLLDDAIAEKNPDTDRTTGIGAVEYADSSNSELGDISAKTEEAGLRTGNPPPVR